MKFSIKIMAVCLIAYQSCIVTGPVITNMPTFMNGGIIQTGDAIACYSLAKILSIKYSIPFCYSHFGYHDLFAFSDKEKSDLTEPIWSSNRKRVLVLTESDIVKNLHNDVVLYTCLQTKIDYVAPQWYEQIKKDFKLKRSPAARAFPRDRITIALHIRKGNGGGQLYDGELLSAQEFDCDKAKIHYDTDFENFPFDWQGYQRKHGYFIKDLGFVAPFLSSVVTFFVNLLGKIEQHLGKDNNIHHQAPARPDDKKVYLDAVSYLATTFPPNQYYIDALRKVSADLQDKPLYVQLLTDDKNPEKLLKRIKKAVNKPNITFVYENDRHLPHCERMVRDLYMLSCADILIRSQSGFSRVAQMLGNHKVVVYPLDYTWENNKLLMNHVVVKGSIAGLLASKPNSSWINNITLAFLNIGNTVQQYFK